MAESGRGGKRKSRAIEIEIQWLRLRRYTYIDRVLSTTGGGGGTREGCGRGVANYHGQVSKHLACAEF